MTNITYYPCDRGTSKPQGFHHFAGEPVVCIYCGAKPKATQ